ncbi:hypothetical protein HK105_202906 [Polyrhizophydium stewartii]|uniref:Uncharacterized protein n=1 Tax=Polyrhizophydium stewartii TaxID=2732419 RepID=A0ABR4NDM7_9FUNG
MARRLPALRKLVLPCNGITSLDLEVDGRFRLLEFLDLSFNAVDHSAQIVLATLPSLKHLDLTSNNISSLAPAIETMDGWRDRVIELLLPGEVAALDAHIIAQGPHEGRLLQSYLERRASSRHDQAASGRASELGHARRSHDSPLPPNPLLEMHNAPHALATIADEAELQQPAAARTDIARAASRLSADHADDRKSVMTDAVHDGGESEYGDAHPLNRTAPSEANAHDIQDQQRALRGAARDLKDADGGSRIGASEIDEPLRVGFCMLEILVLENNKLGSTGSAHFWFILLRVLNLNSNAIRTLCVVALVQVVWLD